MKYISLFSGIEAATVAWQTLGWEPVAYAEIEPFPKAVLKHHYPNVPDLGDMTKVNWKEYHHAADVVVGGSPCQAFSIAGLRKALDDPRGQLMLEYLRACAEISLSRFAVAERGGKGFLGQDELSATLSTHNDQFLHTEDSMNGLTVRRLTPLECERLQGFPDGWTDIPWKGKKHAPDSPRYKALGNSMAVPVMRWIGEGIQLVEDNKGLFQENPSEQ